MLPLLAPPLEQGLTLALVRPLFPATKPANIDRYLPYVSAALRAVGLVDRPMLLAALGTIKAETEGFLPISEFPSQFNTPPGAAPFSAYDGRLGNTQPGDGARFKGRGFVQLTWRRNYAEMGRRLDIDLEADPDQALQAGPAARILFEGMRDGIFTGKKFSDYFDGAREDWINARRIINGLDCAENIAMYARKFYAAISYTTG